MQQIETAPHVQTQLQSETARDQLLQQELDQVMDQYDRSPDALIQVLHRAQGLYGYLPDDVLKYIADGLRIPISKVHGVVSFYSFFSTVPRGKHTVMICMGTACYVKGADRILDRLKSHMDVDVDETTRDNLYTLQIARCIGACGLAPAVIIDSDVHAKLNPQRTLRLLRRYK